jgi:hypothetical protein
MCKRDLQGNIITPLHPKTLSNEFCGTLEHCFGDSCEGCPVVRPLISDFFEITLDDEELPF